MFWLWFVLAILVVGGFLVGWQGPRKGREAREAKSEWQSWKDHLDRF